MHEVHLHRGLIVLEGQQALPHDRVALQQLIQRVTLGCGLGCGLWLWWYDWRIAAGATTGNIDRRRDGRTACRYYPRNATSVRRQRGRLNRDGSGVTWHGDTIPLLQQIAIALLLLLLGWKLRKIRWRRRWWSLTGRSWVGSRRKSSGTGCRRQIVRSVMSRGRFSTQCTRWCVRATRRWIVEPSVERVRVGVRYASSSDVHLGYLR